MTTPHSILLVPAEGSTLLDDGPCGARPPIFEYGPGATGNIARWYPTRTLYKPTLHALVLAYEGKPVREGCGRADWRLHVVSGAKILAPARMTYVRVMALLVGGYSPTCASLRDHLAPLGTVLLLDEHGREIAR